MAYHHLSPPPVDTINQAKAPPTRCAYALEWSLFTEWYSSLKEELSFLQERLEQRLFPFTLKVFVTTIAAHHNALDAWSLGKHIPVNRFLRGARRLKPLRLLLIFSWDLSVVLSSLQRASFKLL